MKEKVIILVLGFIASVVGLLVGWLCVKFMERSVVFKLNKRLFNRKTWWQEKLEARRTDISIAISDEFKLRRAFSGFMKVQHYHTRLGEMNTLTALTFRNPETVILTFIAPIPNTARQHYYLTFDLRDYGYDPTKDFETEILIYDIIQHAVVERLKRI